MLKKQYQKNNSCKVTFVLPKESFHAESANSIKVLGEFNNWNWEEGLTMKAAKEVYEASIKLDAGQSYQFRYVVEGQGWLNDPAADRYLPSPFPGIENSVIDIEAVSNGSNGNGAAKAAKAPAKKAPAKKAEAKKEEAKKAPAKKTVAKKAATTVKATKVAKDDLKKHIEGVGPKIEQLLAKKEITTFEALAKAKISVLKEILDEAGPRFKMHDPATWSEQAKLAAKGEWDKLAKLHEELKGGKRVK